MTPERWREVSELFQAAVELGANEREEYLRQVCANDDTLRREVEFLLAHGRSAEGFLAAPAFEVAAAGVTTDSHQSLVGRRLGSYKT